MTTEQRNTEPILTVTRPKIAAELIRKGYRAEVIPHPWTANMTAWTFQIQGNFIQDAAMVYTLMGVKVPPALRKGGVQE